MPPIPHRDQQVRPETYFVADLKVDVGRQCVVRGDVDVALPKLSFRLLVALIEEAPNVVSNDRLMDLVWPGQVVSPETVNKRANLLREALGDDAKEPRYITGVRGRGYRLIAEVTRSEHADSPPLDPAAGPAEVIPGKRTPKLRLGIYALLVIALAAGIVARISLREHKSQPANALSGSSARTVAVLPFESMSPDTSDAYLARGLPEMVLNRLSRVNGLAVIARNSSFALVTAEIDSREIGRRLNSDFLVNGSVQRKADRLRVAVQLVDAAAGTQVWSASFDRALSDIFSLEDEIADQVAGALSARLGGLGAPADTRQRSANLEAYLAYLRGRALLGRFSVAESEAAVPYFEKAIALDPNFAPAYASLYEARLQLASQRHEDLAPVRQRYRPLIDQALAIDPNSGAAYFARAMWGGASLEARNADFLRGMALDPSNGRGLTAYAEFLDSDMGRPQEGVSILQRALQIDPMSPEAHFYAAQMSLETSGAAVMERNMLAVLELDPKFVPALESLGAYRLGDGKLAEAAQILEHAISLDPGNPKLRHHAMAVYLDLGDEQAARAVAAATPQSARSTTLFALRAGDWRAAGRAAYEDVRWDDDCQNWLEAEALRDYALHTGELNRAVEYIKAVFYFGDDLVATLADCNYLAAVPLSQLLAAQGHASEAQRLRQAAMSDIDAKIAKYGNYIMPRLRAEALLLEGHRDAALDALAADFRSGDYRFWWYTLKHSPLWLPLHTDPRFRTIVSDVQRYIDAERSKLEELRRGGIVPDARRPDEHPRQPRAG